MKQFLLTLTALLLAAATLHAMPAWKRAIQKKQPDGTTITYYIIGDEHSHRLVSIDGYALKEDAQGYLRYAGQLPQKPQIIPQNPRKSQQLPENLDAPHKAKASQYQIGSFPTIGNPHALIILVQFADLTLTFGQDYHTQLMNAPGFQQDGNNGSARDYFIQQSGGLFQPTFDVVGPVTLTHPYSYYGRNDAIFGTDQNAEKMIVEACNSAHEQCGVDFSQYDYDNDGKVDMVYVIYAGYGENAGGGANTVWPKKWNLTQAGYNVTLDGKQLDVYACSAELFGNTGTQSASIGQFCHEFSHVLGLADHYNTTNAQVYNLGAYDLMDYGAYNNDSRTPPSLNAFERLSLAWADPKELLYPEDGIALPPLHSTNQTLRISTQQDPNEFYLLENRQQTSWDTYLPSAGLMITHVQFDPTLWNNNQVNTESNHPRFHLICADNEAGYNVILQKPTEEGDLYPISTNNAFTDHTQPAAKPYTHETLDRWITNIQHANDTLITFDYMANHLKAPQITDITTQAPDAATINWQSNDTRAKHYTLHLTHLTPEEQQPIALAEDFQNFVLGAPQQPNTTDIASQLDQYTQTPGWTGQHVYQAGQRAVIGKQGTTGILQTPPLNLSTYDRNFALILKASSHTGQQPVLTVTANGMQARQRLTSTPRTYLYPFTNTGTTATSIQIQVTNERAYIDTIIVLRGDDATTLYPNVKVVTPTGTPLTDNNPEVPTQYVEAETYIHDSIPTTTFTLTQLLPGQRYRVQVRACADDTESSYSTPIEFQTPQSDDPLGIEPASPSQIPDNPQKSHPQYFLPDGRALSAPPTRGLYLIRQDGHTRKVLRF